MPKSDSSAKALANALMGARTTHDVEKILELARRLYGPLGSRPVGDRPNNSGTIRVSSDPALGVVERVVNAMDAVLDLGHEEHPKDQPGSPREAAVAWFGVPRTGLWDMADNDRRALGERIRVSLDESGDPKRPTLVVEDKGLGQSAASFPKTLLSLNESNKVRQFWNMGVYGQGGAVTFGFSEATIILSRRDPNHRGNKPDTVGWTVVRRVEDPSEQILPNYQYVVDGRDQVLELDPGLFPDLDHGTRVVHIAYDLQGWTGPFTTGLWQFLHSALFDPVLPFLLTGKRSKEKAYGSRIIIGNAARLERPDRARGDLEVAHKDSVRYDLGAHYGSVVFNYWVLVRPQESESDTDAAASYVRADSAVSMTLFGQRQDTKPRFWIKESAKVPFLYKGMIVQIGADALTPVARSAVFASTRERATKSDLLTLIYDRLIIQLVNDDELRRLNHEEKERLLARSSHAVDEKIRQRLAKFIKTRLKNQTGPGSGGAESGAGGQKKGRPGGKPARNIDDSQLPSVPTRLQFKTKRIRVHQGRGGYAWVEINAKNGYLPTHDEDLSISWEGKDPANRLRLTMRSKLLGGLTRWYFEATGDAEIGEYGLKATLVTPNGLLEDTATVNVSVAPPAKPKETATDVATGPRVEWVRKEEWADHNGSLNARTVGYVTEDEEETVIWVNRHLDVLDDTLRGRSLTPEQIEKRSSRYLYPIACALWLQDHTLRTADPRPSPAYARDEMRRVAEAVLVAIDPDVEVAGEEAEEL